MWTVSKVNADSSSETKRVVFKLIEMNSTFVDKEVFAPNFPSDYIVSDVTSGTSVILQNPHPEIPLRE